MKVPFSSNKKEKAVLELLIAMAIRSICKGVPENAAPSLGFFPGLDIFSKLDLHNGIGFLPSVRKIVLY